MSSRLKEPVQDKVPYTSQALRNDLRRVRNAWAQIAIIVFAERTKPTL
jgi:hypothetical protein